MTQPQSLTIALLFSTPGTAWGGMERHTADLAQALAHRGHQVHVIGHESYRRHFSTPVHFHAAPVQLGRRNPLLHFFLKRQVHRIAPDILHAQGNKSAQLIRHIHPKRRCARVGTIHGSKSSHRAFQNLDSVIAVSPHIFDNLDHPHKQLIFNGIAPTAESARKGDEARILPEGVMNVVAVGRLEPVKGFETLIRAWAKLAGDDTNAHLSVFGEGTLKSGLQELVTSLGLEARVTLAGYRADLAPVYRQADLMVISSQREGFPYVLIESLLAGCPIISTPVSGPAYLLPAQAVSPDWEPENLAYRLRDALSNLAALREAESAAMTFAREKLTLECMTSETERLYREALSASNADNT
ncbi:glycosyltransferase [Marinobacter arenosus]|uniref:glycosyltransferase n=1 Tax=Marinobacter arenosus TaxID=2856822 RepID=UPI001C4DAA88|nr:glycosyltransferase [Marinobacter arenosus]MBW0149366.1 glycosyltransferase [Marinobacter arenosus]